MTLNGLVRLLSFSPSDCVKCTSCIQSGRSILRHARSPQASVGGFTVRPWLRKGRLRVRLPFVESEPRASALLATIAFAICISHCARAKMRMSFANFKPTSARKPSGKSKPALPICCLFLPMASCRAQLNNRGLSAPIQDRPQFVPVDF